MARKPSDRTRPTLSTVQALAVASQFGITLAVSVVVGYFVGQWLDGRLGTGIIFSLIGVLLGLVAAVTGTIGLYRSAMRKVQAPKNLE
jgi:F0F1-type ATP synthase assembly protein I